MQEDNGDDAGVVLFDPVAIDVLDDHGPMVSGSNKENLGEGFRVN